MSLVTLNNRALKDATAVGSITGLGDLVFISRSTASSSSSLNITSGIDSTYKEYIFFFNNIHPAQDGTNGRLTFNLSIDGGSNYNVTKTTTNFEANHSEDNSATALTYKTARDLAQSTSDQIISNEPGHDNDQCMSGYMHLFNPSSTTFVRHFLIRQNSTYKADYTVDVHIAGYFNTTSAIDAITFKPDSGTIDTGDICLYGIN